MRAVACAALGAFLIAASGAAAAPGDEPTKEPARRDGGMPALDFEEGRPFPDIVLPSAEDGRPMSLADFRGEKVVLHVFASW